MKSAATTAPRPVVVGFGQKANRPGDATNAPGHDTEEVTSMPDKRTPKRCEWTSPTGTFACAKQHGHTGNHKSVRMKP